MRGIIRNSPLYNTSRGVTTVSKSTTKGEVTASETAVGATVSVGVVLEDTEASLNRSLTSTNGGLALTADSDSTDIVLADAVAAGAVLDKYTNKLGVSKGDLLGSNSSPAKTNETPDSMSGLDGEGEQRQEKQKSPCHRFTDPGRFNLTPS